MLGGGSFFSALLAMLVSVYCCAEKLLKILSVLSPFDPLLLSITPQGGDNSDVYLRDGNSLPFREKLHYTER